MQSSINYVCIFCFHTILGQLHKPKIIHHQSLFNVIIIQFYIAINWMEFERAVMWSIIESKIFKHWKKIGVPQLLNHYWIDAVNLMGDPLITQGYFPHIILTRKHIHSYCRNTYFGGGRNRWSGCIVFIIRVIMGSIAVIVIAIVTPNVRESGYWNMVVLIHVYCCCWLYYVSKTFEWFGIWMVNSNVYKYVIRNG